MFNLTRFWLGTAAYVIAIGGVIAAAGFIFSAFIGGPAEDPPLHTVTQPAPVEAGKPAEDAKPVQDNNAEPAEKRAVAAPSAPPTPPSAPRKPKASVADVGTTARTLPDIQIIVPEPRSGGRGASRQGF
jgi:hypothetical protein